MLSPLAVGLGFGKWGSSKEEAGPSRSSPKGKGKEKEETPMAVQSFWSKSSTLYGLGAVALGAAAAGTAYYRREDFMNGWKWGFDHMTFVRNLWDDAAMKERLDTLDRLSKERNIMFWKYVPVLSEFRDLLMIVSTPIYRQHRQNRRSAEHSPSYQQRHIQHTTAGGPRAIH